MREVTWDLLKKGVWAGLLATFNVGWYYTVKEAGKQILKYLVRKTLGCITDVVCGYFGSVSSILIAKFVKVCYLACSGGLDVV